MPPIIFSEAAPATPVFSISSSKKWLVQVSLLFGLLLLSRWERAVPVPMPLVAAAAAPLTAARSLMPPGVLTDPLNLMAGHSRP
jgi:hypothetical protein